MTSRMAPGWVRGRVGTLLRRWRALIVGATLISVAQMASAQIYGATDDEGHWVLSNHALESDATPVIVVPGQSIEPTPSVAAPTVSMPVGATGSAAAMLLPPAVPAKLLTPIIREAARRHGVPVDLLTAVIAVESGFDERAVSGKGAKGLMQLMPDTARRFGVKDIFAADQNLRAGAAYLRTLMNQFPEDFHLALAAYNAGEGAVLRAGRRIPAFPETQQYVRKVLARLAQLSEPANSVRR